MGCWLISAASNHSIFMIYIKESKNASLILKRVKGEPKLLLPLAYNLADTANVTGLSTRTLRRLVKRGLLHPSRASHRLIFSRGSIEKFLAETTTH